ncbi:MAG: hypothetical protein ACRC6V_04650, partial [Bacteroidales bacterium]
SSNEAVLGLTDSTGHTGAGTGEATNILIPRRAGTSVVTATCGDGRASYLVTVKDPDVKLRMSANIVEHGGLSLAIVTVKNAKGEGVDGVTVNFTADPFSLVNMPERSVVTAGGGIAESPVTAADTSGLVQIQASVGTVKSNHARLEIVEKAEVLIMRIDQRVISHGVNDKSIMTVQVVNAIGQPIPNKKVNLLSTNQTVIILNKEIDTAGTGVYEQALTAAGLGEAEISARLLAQEVSIDMEVTKPEIILGCPSTATEGVAFNMSAVVKRSDDTDLVGVSVQFKSDPPFSPLIPETSTTGGGIARATYTPVGNSDLSITATVGNVVSNTCEVAVSAP